jgi:hypothetical protein
MRKAISEKHRRALSGNAVAAETKQQGARDPTNLAQLVWKHFEDEIREALMEVQETLAAEQAGPSEQGRQERSYENEESSKNL